MKLTADQIMAIIRNELAKEQSHCKAIKANTLDPSLAHPDDTLTQAARWKATSARVNVLENLLYEIEQAESIIP